MLFSALMNLARFGKSIFTNEEPWKTIKDNPEKQILFICRSTNCGWFSSIMRTIFTFFFRKIIENVQYSRKFLGNEVKRKCKKFS